MRRSGKIGPVLPTSAKGHCGFIDSWSIKPCYAAASEHILFDRPGGSGMFVCSGHTAAAVATFNPPDRHPVASECIHPKSDWQESTGKHTGFCFVPHEGTESLKELRVVSQS